MKKGGTVWIRNDTDTVNNYAPTFGEVVTVDFYSQSDSEFCCFREYPEIDPLDNDRHYFFEDEFEPLVSDAVLREELEQVPEPFTVSR